MGTKGGLEDGDEGVLGGGERRGREEQGDGVFLEVAKLGWLFVGFTRALLLLLLRLLLPLLLAALDFLLLSLVGDRGGDLVSLLLLEGAGMTGEAEGESLSLLPSLLILLLIILLMILSSMLPLVPPLLPLLVFSGCLDLLPWWLEVTLLFSSITCCSVFAAASFAFGFFLLELVLVLVLVLVLSSAVVSDMRRFVLSAGLCEVSKLLLVPSVEVPWVWYVLWSLLGLPFSLLVGG